MVENLYISPAVKRPVYQSLKIMHEINKIQGHAPKKIFVEMTRKDGVKGDKGRKESRKTKLVDLYKKCGEDSGELWESLEKHLMMNLKETDCIFTTLNSASVCTRENR